MVKSLILWDGGSITVQITVSNDVDVIPHCNKFNQNTIIFLKKYKKFRLDTSITKVNELNKK